jgi:F-type H+-transporting ATPase subunit alpha
MDSIVKRIESAIASYTPSEEPVEVGYVRAGGDGIADISGLRGAIQNEMILFDRTHDRTLEEALSDSDPVYGLVLNLEEGGVRAVILGNTDKVYEGMLVRRTKNLLSIPVGDSLLGRVVNPLGEPVDGKGALANTVLMPIEREAYGVIDRSSVNTPLHTGTKAIDAMVAIGRGQRELIIGDRGTGKTTIAIDAIVNQLNEPEETRPVCIYVAIGQKESKTARIVAELEEKGALSYTVVVTAAASSPAALQYLAPFAGATIGEYFMEKGRDALVVYDDLTKQAIAYRQLSLLLKRPPGREAYPGDVFYLHSRLLERAAKLSKEKGGGSLTALPIIETQENDISAYIPTNVISITDGQIFLETGLFNKGIRPAINVGLSVSRVGGSAQTKAMKKVAGGVRILLAQYRELEAFSQFASDLDEATKAQLLRGRRMTELLVQRKGAPIPFEEQVLVLFAASNGLVDDVEPEKVRDIADEYVEFVKREKSDVVVAIRTEKQLGDELMETMKAMIVEFKTRYGNE